MRLGITRRTHALVAVMRCCWGAGIGCRHSNRIMVVGPAMHTKQCSEKFALGYRDGSIPAVGMKWGFGARLQRLVKRCMVKKSR